MTAGRRPPDRDRRLRAAGDVDAAWPGPAATPWSTRAHADADPDLLAGPFAHIVVDEAQELTDAEWQMLLLRCPSRSFTIVGDRAQARHGFTESWQERLERVGLAHVNHASLSINYRTPEEVMAEAEPVIRAVLPDANVPTSIRSSGVPVEHGSTADLRLDPRVLARRARRGTRLRDRRRRRSTAARSRSSRVRSLTPELTKGLEFDLVVLIDPDTFGDGIEGAVDHYVAMTRATQRLVILTSQLGVRRGEGVAAGRERVVHPHRRPRLVRRPRRRRRTPAPTPRPG